MRHRFQGVVITSSMIYTGALLLLVLLQRTWLEGVWWVRLAAYALPHLFLPLLLFLPLVVLSKSRLAKAVILVPCLLFLLLYGNLFLPQLAGAEHEGEIVLRVMTYNATHGTPGVDQILSIIETEKPDVIALQEVSAEVAEALSGLDEMYPYMALHPQAGYSGSGVLSRFPILDDEAFRLTEGAHLYQHVVLDVEGKSVHLLNIHLHLPVIRLDGSEGSLYLNPRRYSTRGQDLELDRLLEELDGLEGLLIVAGDFNMTDQSSGYRRLTGRLGDAFRDVGWGFGYTFPDGEMRSIPIPFPFLRIDYIFHSSDIGAQRAYVGDRGGPDHRFLVAELAL